MKQVVKQVIKVAKGERERLAIVHNVTTRYVGYALAFDSKRDSDKAKQIRKDALLHGGKIKEVTIVTRDIETPKQKVKVLNSKGEVEREVTV